MNRNDDFSKRRVHENAPNSLNADGAPTKKTVDELLNEMDNWDKIAAGFDDAATFDFDSNGEHRWKTPQPSDSAPRDADRADKSEKTSSYLVSYDDDKFDEDYETRVQNRGRSLWNRGEWVRDDQRRDAGPDRRAGEKVDAAPENRQYSRNDRPNFNRSDDQNRRPRADRYRQDGYRQNGQRPDNYRQDGYRQYGPRSDNYRQDGGYRQDNYRSDNYRQDGGYRQDGNRRDANRDYRRQYPDANDRQENGYRNNYRPFYRDGGDRNANSDQRRDDYARRRFDDRDQTLEPTIGLRGKRGEPLSLAEEISARQYKNRAASARERHENDGETSDVENATSERVETAENVENAENAAKLEFDDRVVSDDDRQEIAELEKLDSRELVEEARRQNLETIEGERRRDLVVRVLRARLQKNGLMYGEGTLEILPDEFGFLRSPDSRYISCPDDIYISPSQIRRFGLRDGLTIFGQIRPPKERERYFALLRVETINDEDPNALASKPFFDDLIAVHPTERVVLENAENDLDLRVLDLVAPLGFGQRGLIVSPPRAGKTTLIQKMAQAIVANYPDAYVFVLLVDERPEEVTEMERKLSGPRCEVVGSTFDETPQRHVQASEITLEKAKRMVEYGRNVVVFLDSLTALTRAWNAECPESGKLVPGSGIDANALQPPKKFFGSARQVDGGGSLTIVATLRVDSGSQTDEAIFEEFKGTGNLEIYLDRSLAEKRNWPAVDVVKSGAQREETIFNEDEFPKIDALRKRLATLPPLEAAVFLQELLKKTENNAVLLNSVNFDER